MVWWTEAFPLSDQSENNMTEPNESKYRYWFRAKKYGWGWGFPSAWQGWATLFLYLGVIYLGAYLFPPAEKTTAFIVLSIVVSVLLIVIAWAKGEPPRWRWGKE